MRYTPSGASVCTISVACNRRYKKASGEVVDETVWFKIQVWGTQGEACQQYLHKGSQVLVEGRLIPDRTTGGPRTYVRTSGEPGASFEINAETVRFLGSRTEEGEARNDEAAGTTPAPTTEEELPF